MRLPAVRSHPTSGTNGIAMFDRRAVSCSRRGAPCLHRVRCKRPANVMPSCALRTRGQHGNSSSLPPHAQLGTQGGQSGENHATALVVAYIRHYRRLRRDEAGRTATIRPNRSNGRPESC